MGSEEKSKTKITFFKPGYFDFNTQYQLYAMTKILNIRLRKLLREEMSATYHVGVRNFNSAPGDTYATTTISFSSAPDNVDLMTDAIFNAIKSFKKEGPTNSEIQNIIEKDLNQREINLQTNTYWLNAISSCFIHEVHPNDILYRNKRIESLTTANIQKLAKKHFPKYRYSKITLYPKNGE
jgi:zinc protease